MKFCLGYLSGAPRVSTAPQAELGGARTHVLGIITAFERLGWEVKPYIVGDKVPRKWVTKGSEKAVSSGFFRTLIVDLVRLITAAVYSRQAWQDLGGTGGLGIRALWYLSSYGQKIQTSWSSLDIRNQCPSL